MLRLPSEFNPFSSSPSSIVRNSFRASPCSGFLDAVRRPDTDPEPGGSGVFSLDSLLRLVLTIPVYSENEK